MKIILMSVLLVSTFSKTREVDYTVYNALPGQTDNTPNITADMSVIDNHKVISGEQRWIAVSRDLLKEFNYGDSVVISGCNDKKYNGKWVIHDTMNKRFKNKIDFLVPKNIKLGKGKCKIISVVK